MVHINQQLHTSLSKTSSSTEFYERKIIHVRVVQTMNWIAKLRHSRQSYFTIMLQNLKTYNYLNILHILFLKKELPLLCSKCLNCFEQHFAPFSVNHAHHPSFTYKKVSINLMYANKSNPTIGLERSLGLPEFLDNRHMKVVSSSALCTGQLYPPGDTPGTHFC